MKTGEQKVMKLPVSTILQESYDTKTFRFELGSHRPFHFLPGQFIIITAELWNPKRGRTGQVSRAFSISSSPTDEEFIEITVKRYQDGRMTPWLHDAVQVGHVLMVKGPDGEFVFRDGETDELILIAGGVGIAPFRSMIRHILHRGFPVQIRLLYSARTPGDFAFAPEFDALAGQHPHFHVLYTVSRPGTQAWSGRVSRVDETLLRQNLGKSGALYYLCGPNQMIDDVAWKLRDLHVPESAIRFERW